ncbi:MAG: hypothetical protein COB12_06805 [Flavobacterium sp.]|nr:MAG: hypothetical protein COB12_06805 [Flavobacterium sp.]
MKNNIHLLKQSRTDADVRQQDVAFLLNIDSGNLARYENEKRSPTPEVLLSYHILFGIPISELLNPLHQEITENLILRSKLLPAQPTAKQTPKSKHSIAYLQAVVNDLTNIKTYDL